jgi:phage-related protein
MATLDLLVKVAVKNQKALDSLSGKLRGAGTALSIGVTGPLVAAGAAMVNLAADAEKSQAKLESVFQTTGAAAWTSVEALNAHAEALARTTTFDDDALKEAQAALLSFGTITGHQFSQATANAADLAAFLETDVATAAQQLGKALADPEAGLGRLQKAIGPLTDEQQELIDHFIEIGDTASAQQIILDAVAAKIGNVAEDLAQTSGGQMTQAMNQLGEAGEALGTFLLPILSGVATGLKDMALAFTNLDPTIQQFILIAGGIAIVLGPVLLILSAMIPAIAAIGVAIGVILSPIGLLVVAVVGMAVLIAAKWDELVAATQAFGRMFAAIFQAIGTAFSNLGRAIGNVWDNIVDVFTGAVNAIAGVGRRIWDPLAKGFSDAIDVIRGIWNAFARFWNSIQISVPAVDVPFLGRVGGFNVGLPDLPHLAQGGIVDHATLAVIGEKGPEAVVPLDKGYGTHETHIHLTYSGEMPDEPEDLVALLRQVAPFVDGRLRVAD